MAWTSYRELLLVVQRPGLPAEADWAHYTEDAGRFPFVGALVIGEGNKLTPLQRAEVERWLKRNRARNAVVTNSTVSRAVMIALGWFGVPVKAFAPSDLMGALEYLGLAGEYRGEALVLVDRLRRLLDGQRPKGSGQSRSDGSDRPAAPPPR